MGNLKRLSIPVIIFATLIFIVASCSNSEENTRPGNNEETNASTENIDEDENNEGEENNTQEETDSDKDFSEMSHSELEEHFPPTEYFIHDVPLTRFTTDEVDLSKVEKEVLDTLSEYQAVEDGSLTTLTLPDNILFDFDSDELHSEANEEIKKLAQVIESTDDSASIVGHTDNKGETDYNQKLSERRAQAVLDALVDEGIDKNRLEAEGRGETEPIARNEHSNGDDDPDGRQKNRRVEVTVDGL